MASVKPASDDDPELSFIIVFYLNSYYNTFYKTLEADGMITKRFPLYHDLLNIGMLYMLIISFFMMLATNMHIPIMPLEFIATGVILISCYLLREHVSRLRMYVILHFVMIVVCLFLPLEGTGKLRLTITAVVLFLFDLRNRINHKKSVRDLPAVLGVLFIPILFYTGIGSEFGYTAAVYYMGVTFVVLVLIRKLIRNFHELSKTGQLNDDMPVKEIFRNNTVISVVIIAGITGAMLFIHADRLVLSLNRMLLNAMYTERQMTGKTAYPDKKGDLPFLLFEGIYYIFYSTLPGDGTTGPIGGDGFGTGYGDPAGEKGSHFGNMYDPYIQRDGNGADDNVAVDLCTVQFTLNPSGWINNKTFVITLFDYFKKEEKSMIIRPPYSITLPLKNGKYRIERICLYGSINAPLKYDKTEFTVDKHRTLSISLNISDSMDSMDITPAGYALWLFIAAILYCFCRAVISLFRALTGKRIKQNKTVQWKNEVRQSIPEDVVKERKRSIRLTPYEKIRDLYKRGLEKYKKDGVNIRNTKTPEENRESIRSKKGIDLGEATELYEQIRYTEGENATAKDVAAMKKCLKL